VTLALPTLGVTFKARLEQDEHGILWVHAHQYTRIPRPGRFTLYAVLSVGWRIVRTSPDEQAVLDVHGFDI